MSHHLGYGKFLEDLDVTTLAPGNLDEGSAVVVSTRKGARGLPFDGRAHREGFSFQLSKIQELTMENFMCHGVEARSASCRRAWFRLA